MSKKRKSSDLYGVRGGSCTVYPVPGWWEALPGQRGPEVTEARMGAHLARRYLGDADVEPDPLRMPTFDSGLGFEERKERVMIATQQQMNDAQLPLDQRDYCAHYLIKLMKCRRDNFPNFLACRHERHDWDYCEHLDYVMRMKEFERERRLLVRKKRLEQKEAAGA